MVEADNVSSLSALPATAVGQILIKLAKFCWNTVVEINKPHHERERGHIKATLGLCSNVISIVCISKEILFYCTYVVIEILFFLLFNQHNCEERVKHNSSASSSAAAAASSQRKVNTWGRSSDKLQCAIYYAIDGDQVRLQAIFRLLILGRTSIGLLGGKLMIPHRERHCIFRSFYRLGLIQ